MCGACPASHRWSFTLCPQGMSVGCGEGAWDSEAFIAGLPAPHSACAHLAVMNGCPLWCGGLGDLRWRNQAEAGRHGWRRQLAPGKARSQPVHLSVQLSLSSAPGRRAPLEALRTLSEAFGWWSGFRLGKASKQAARASACYGVGALGVP